MEFEEKNNVVELKKAGRPANPPKYPNTEFPFEMDINTKTGKYTNTLQNIYKATKSHEVTGFKFGYDKFKSSEMLLVDSKWSDIDDDSITKLRLSLEQLDMPRVSKDDARNAINLVCKENSFDSAIDWITSLEWDDKPRVKTFFSHYFSAIGNHEYIESVSLYAWTALAGRIITPGIKADMVPLIFGEQGVGKSTGIEKMCPFPDAFTKVDLSKNDDDLARKVRGCLIAEWEELRGLSGRDSESTKAFISSKSDKWIPKFKEFAVENYRRLLFMGTTNNKEILTDATGNRRYLPFEAGKVKFDAIEADRDQLWAEALHLYKEHGVMWQKAEELAVKVHDEYRVTDSWEDDICDYLEIGSPKEMQFVSIEAIFSRLGLMVGKTNRNHAERLKAIMSRLGYEKGRKKINNQYKRGYLKK
ncbi:MAG TPA: VapE domain-containing protein [Arsenophonus nasoniae]|uniref:VapE domain-containing protein n=1 Tax=Arsenophonus nasoniae TaxID=638 RepID=UPI00387A49A6